MRIYYGWPIAIIALAAMAIAMGSTFQSFGIFIRPVSEDLGLSRADAYTGVILFQIGTAIWSPVVGKMLDRMPIRPIMIASALLLGASLMLLGVSRLVWLNAILLFVAVPIAVQGAGSLAVTTLVARWFKVHRGRAMAIALFGTPLAGIVVTPAIALCVEQFDWRETLIGVGVVVALLLAALGALTRERPGPDDIESADDKAKTAHTANDAPAKPVKAVSLLLNPYFWAIAGAASLTLGMTSAVVITFVPLAEEFGASPTQAASLISILSGAGLVGGAVAAWIADRVNRYLLLSGVFVLVAAIAVLLFFSRAFEMFAVSAALLGLSTGVAYPAFNAALADRFGAASFGTVAGLAKVLLTVFGAVAVRFAGEIFDRTGSYEMFFATMCGVEILAAALIFGAWMTGRGQAPLVRHTPGDAAAVPPE